MPRAVMYGFTPRTFRTIEMVTITSRLTATNRNILLIHAIGFSPFRCHNVSISYTNRIAFSRLGFAAIPAVKPIILVKMRQAGRRVHPVQEDLAIQVIKFVLEGARGESGRFAGAGPAIFVDRLYSDARRPCHAAAQVRHREATLPVLLGFIRAPDNSGVDENGEREGGRLWIPRIVFDFDDGDSDGLVNLRRGQADAAALAHRIDHVQKELPGRRRLPPPVRHG